MFHMCVSNFSKFICQYIGLFSATCVSPTGSRAPTMDEVCSQIQATSDLLTMFRKFHHLLRLTCVSKCVTDSSRLLKIMGSERSFEVFLSSPLKSELLFSC
jgi:hypothetical protein